MNQDLITIDESIANLETLNNLKGFIFPVE
jgi:hypothetical protein